jgi:DNA modification methylase
MASKSKSSLKTKSMQTNIIYEGNCETILPTLKSNSVDCVVTSPPYYGLRLIV